MPYGWNPYTSGSGIGLLPRRGIDAPGFLNSRDALMRLGANSPLQLLIYAADLHPAVGLAAWNAVRLSCAPGDLKIKAHAPGGKDQTDDAGTESIDQLWSGLPAEIGGLDGLRATLTLSALFTGLPCLEAVPGPRGSGVRWVWPVDSLTLRFDRDPVTSVAIPYQRQIYQIGDPRADKLVAGYRRLDTSTFFFRPIDNFPDDPYGRGPYAPALNEVLCDLAMMQDLRDAIHNAAWPRTAEGFNFKETAEIATTLLNMTVPEDVAAFVQQRFQEHVLAVSKRSPADNVVFDSNGTFQTVEGSQGFAALKEILVYLRQRIVQALKTLPTLMGINDGATQTYTSVEWSIYAAGLQTVQGIVAELLVKTANLHLQLQGLPLVAKAAYSPIRTTDDLIEAQAEALRLSNGLKKLYMGWISNEDLCLEITGTKPVGDPPEDIGALIGVAPEPETPPVTAPAGSGQEEQNAAKGGEQA